jgi:type I restriction enzyme S subunit
LGDIAKWGSGGTPSAGNPAFYGGDIPWAVIGDLTEGLVTRTKASITEAGLSKSAAKVVPEGAILIAMYGASIGRLGITARPMATNQAIAHALTTDRLNPKFLFYYLLSQKRGFVAAGKGAAQPNIGQAILKAWPIEYPEDPTEQQRIVNILEDHLSRLDASDSLATTALRRLQVLHKSVLLDLIPDAKAYPVHWNQSTVSQAGNVTLGRQRHPDWHNGPNMHPYLRVANVFEDRIDLSDVMEMHWPDDSFERFRLKPGDVLLNEGQSPEFLGRPAMYTGTPVDIAFTNTLIRFQANDGVLPEFALLVFRRHMHAGRFAQESRITTNIAHLSASRLKPIEFPIPPLDEQKQLAGLAEQQLGDASRLGDQVRLLKLKSKVLRRALLGAAFSGRLTGKSIDMEIVEEMAGG